MFSDRIERFLLEVICVFFGFAFLCLVISLKNVRHCLDQSQVKLKPTAIHSHVFSRALYRLHVFASGFDWFTGLPVCCMIGHSTLVLVFRHSIKVY